jgi:predicted metal-binding protein
MMQNLTEYLEDLGRRAEGFGASSAAAIPASDVVIDGRTSLKCLVPLCRHYGTDLLCPPNVMPVEQFRGIVAQYGGALLVTVDMALSDEEGEERLKLARDAKMKLYDVIDKVEAAAMRDGHYYAAGFGGGACSLCEECVGVGSGLRCRHPFRARPAMEAMGIDVVETARRVGLDLTFEPGAGRSWVGLVLVG